MNGDQQPPMMLPQPKSKTWLWVIIGIVALVALLTALYYYGSVPRPAGETTGDVSDIDAELQATALEGLDSELQDIEKELQQP